jgi:CrcB protein
MGSFSSYLWVAVGGALGSLARYWVGIVVTSLTGPAFPWAVLLINVVGSFIIGWFGALTGPGGRVVATTDMRIFVMVGLCGGFTTFSSFSVQTLQLLQAGETVRAGGNIVLSVGLCLLAVWLGWLLGQGGMPRTSAG